MERIEILGFIAAGFELLGLFLLGKKYKIGFLVNLAGGLSWIAFSIISQGTFGLLAVCSVAIVLNIRGFYLWSK